MTDSSCERSTELPFGCGGPSSTCNKELTLQKPLIDHTLAASCHAMRDSPEYQKITEIVRKLSNGFDSLTDEQLLSELTILKTLSRTKHDAEALYTSSGVSLLCRLSFVAKYQLKQWCREAKRCLANAMTLEDSTILHFRHINGLPDLVASYPDGDLGHCSVEDEFLFSRILFLYTAKTGISVGKELESIYDVLVRSITVWFARHQQKLSVGHQAFSESEVISLKETLKLSYNIALFTPALWTASEISTFALMKDLERTGSNAMKSCLPLCINLLVVTKVEAEEVSIIMNLFQEYVSSIADNQKWHDIEITEGQLTPLIKVISDAFERFKGDLVLRKQIEEMLLVPDSERNVVLGKSGSTPAKLLRILNSATHTTRECISALLYQVSDSDASKFVENIGYGHAAGFLTAHGIAAPPDQMSSDHGGKIVNPITGQNKQDEEEEQARRALAEMTDEEKEREAEKLFVLFQRLKKNGVIDVKDPIQQAVDEGRFQEL